MVDMRPPSIPVRRARASRRSIGWGVIVAMVALVGSVLVASPATAAVSAPQNVGAGAVDSGIVKAAAVVGFNPENIISDGLFYDGAAMTSAEIQAFLDARIGACSNGKCLNVLNAGISSRSAVVSQTTGNLICSAIQGGVMRVSELIYRVQVACGISAKVILVTLQKEQGLTTSTAPTDRNLAAAMGASCPDTAPCDPAFAGVGPQILKGAQQLKTYRAANFGKQPGVNYIGYSPTAACGGTNLNLRNYATAALYSYTPYQPNPASLAAGYGLGDGCSSYGNRNFYNYFTQWFGSTQARATAMVRTESNATVYLVSGTKRYSVGDIGDYLELARVYGAAVVVPDSYLSMFTNAGAATSLLRDESTGDMWLIQGGQLHKLLTCESVQQWGSTCAAPINVSSALLGGIPTGASVSNYFTVRGMGRWGRMDAGAAVTPLWDAAAAGSANGGTVPTAFEISPTLYAAKSKSPMQFAPGQLVRSNENPQVYMTADTSKLLSVKAWSDVTAYGRPASSVAFIPQAELSARYTVAGAMSPTLRCDGVTYIGASGQLVALSDPARAGLPTNDVSAITCAAFPVSPNPVTGPLFIKSSSAPWVYLVEAGATRRISSWAALLGVSGGVAPTILVLPADALAALPVGAAVMDGDLVKIGASPTISVVSGSTRSAITSLAAASDAGIRLEYTAISDSEGAALTEGPALGQWVSCGNITWFVGGGRRMAVTDSAATGFTSIALTDAACARIPASSSSAVTQVFVKSASAPQVYLAGAGTYRVVTDWATLMRVTGGVVPPIVVMSDGVLAGLPKGAPVT